MANFILSYDLNGSKPSHSEVDAHLEKLGATRGRVLESVWYVGCDTTAEKLVDYMDQILGDEDQILVVEASDAAWRNLLITDESMQEAWNDNE